MLSVFRDIVVQDVTLIRATLQSPANGWLGFAVVGFRGIPPGERNFGGLICVLGYVAIFRIYGDHLEDMKVQFLH